MVKSLITTSRSFRDTVILCDMSCTQRKRTTKSAKLVDWSKVGKEAYLSAMERSPVNDLEIKTLLQGALTDAIDDREVYMKGIQSPYAYEGQESYDVHQLFDNK